MRTSTIWVALTVLVTAAGCAPETTLRRTALVPAARMLPWDGRTAPAGSLRVEGAFTASRVRENPFPLVGDTALHVPRVAVDGSAVLAATGGLEVGARYSHGIYSADNTTAVGTPPIPSGTPTTGFGPEIHGTVRFGKSGDFALGFGGNLLFYTVPVAYWVLDDTCTSGPNCFDSTFDTTSLGPVRYRLEREDKVSKAVVNITILANYQFGSGKFGHVFGGFGVHDGFRNQGFTNNSNAPPVEGAGFVPLIGAGYGIKIDIFRAAVLASYAATGAGSAVNYDVATGFLTLGIDIPLWTPAPSPAEPPAPPPGGPPPGYYYGQPPPPGYAPPPGYGPAPQPGYAPPPQQQQPAPGPAPAPPP